VRGAAEDAAFLTALLRVTARAADADEVLRLAGALIVEQVGDWVLADRLADPDLVVRVAALGPDGPLALPALSGLEQPRRSSAFSGGALRRLSAAATPVLHLSADDLEALLDSKDPRLRAQAELTAALGTLEVVVFGTGARGRLNGVLSVGRTTTPFSAADLALLELVALQVGLALDAARLLEAQRGVSAAMQTSLLPPLPLVPGLDLAARYQAAAQGLDVGGDWYDAFTLPDGAIAVVIGDATGHDTTAAVRMSELRNQLRALAVDRCERPSATLTRLDRTGRALAGDASATCLYAQLRRDGSGWRLRWSSAGHLPPVLVRAGHAELAQTPPDLMLGVDPDSPRSDHEARLDSGDLVLLCTDGLVEQRRVPLDERLEVLLELVARSPGLHPEALAELVLGTLAQDGDDDVALLAVRVCP